MGEPAETKTLIPAAKRKDLAAAAAAATLPFHQALSPILRTAEPTDLQIQTRLRNFLLTGRHAVEPGLPARRSPPIRSTLPTPRSAQEIRQHSQQTWSDPFLQQLPGTALQPAELCLERDQPTPLLYSLPPLRIMLGFARERIRSR